MEATATLATGLGRADASGWLGAGVALSCVDERRPAEDEAGPGYRFAQPVAKLGQRGN
jgi:hypothetical protein